MGGSSDHSEQTAIKQAIREDINRWRAIRLHWVVAGTIIQVLALTALGIAGFSVAIAAELTLRGFVEHMTINASWFFVSLFGLVGLFAAYPAHVSESESALTRHSRTTFLGALLSRWLLVATSVFVGFIIPLVLGILTFDSFPIGPAIGFVTVTALSVIAYTAIGMTLVSVVGSNNRLVLSMLATYWLLVHLWETSLIPLVVGIGVTGEPEGAIGTPPLVHDILLAASPNGAHAALSEWLVSGGFDIVTVVALLAIVGWLTLPFLIALWRD